MDNHDLKNHPFLNGNILSTSDSDGNNSFYKFSLDLIASNHSINEVQSFPGFHEVIHRASSNYGNLTNSFTLLRQISGIIHALLMHLITYLEDENISLSGKTYDQITVKNGSDEQTRKVNSIVKRILNLESIFEMGWRAIIPVAELMAIDFSHNLYPGNYFYHGWKLDMYYELMEDRKNDQSKLEQLKHSIRGFPENFSGYNVKYGSFSKAMEKAFMAYNSFENYSLRMPILDLALHVLYLDENDQLVVNDPLFSIINLCSNPNNAKNEYFLKELQKLRHGYGIAGKRLVNKLAVDSLFDLPESISDHKFLTTALIYLMVEQKSGELDHIYYSGFIDWIETLSRSFIRAVTNNNAISSLAMNPNYLIAANYRICKKNNLEYPLNETKINRGVLDDPIFLDLWSKLPLQPDWWRRLILLESLRYSLKIGKPLKCPMHGPRIEENNDLEIFNQSIRCNKECIIRSWLIKLGENTEIIDRNPICNP